MSDTPLTRVPYLAHWFDLWLMHEPAFFGLAQMVEQMNISVHLDAVEQARAAGDGLGSAPVEIRDGVAIVPIMGTLMKHASSMGDATSTVVARKQIRDAANSDKVKSILLQIESPGGTVSGTMELGQEIAAAKALKPVWAYCEDLCASAAYWVASQADKILATEISLVGSIGTYGVVQDYSAAAAMKGIKVHVIRAGEHKGAATPGTEVTSGQLAEFQRRIDETNAFFLRAVSNGRNMPLDQVTALADGRVHRAGEAIKLKLIDGLASFDQAFSNLASQPSRSSIRMSDTQTTPAAPAAPQPATYAELKAALQGADNDFVCKMLEEQKTLPLAQAAWMGEMSNRLKASNEELAKAKQQPQPKAAGAAVLPLSGAAAEQTSGSDAIANFEQAVDARMLAHKCSKADATQHVCRTQPELYQAYVDQYNAQHGRKSCLVA